MEIYKELNTAASKEFPPEAIIPTIKSEPVNDGGAAKDTSGRMDRQENVLGNKLTPPTAPAPAPAPAAAPTVPAAAPVA